METRANAPEGRRRWLRRAAPAEQAEVPAVPLSERVAAAEERVRVIERSNALFEAPSDDEIDARIAAGRRLRALALDQEVREGEAEIEARELEASRLRALARKDAAEQDRRRAEEAEIRRWKLRAGDKAEQLTSKSAQLAETAKLLVTGKRAIIAGIVLLLIWSGVNVQQQLVPGNDVGDPLFWISYALDVTLGGTLVLLMLTSATTARAGMNHRNELVKGWKWSRYLQEAAILGASLALNTATHLRNGEHLLAAKSAIPPIMVGMLVWAYNHITNQLSETLLKLTDDLETHEQLVRDLEAARSEIDAQRQREEALQGQLAEQAAALQSLNAETAMLVAERDSREEIVLDEKTLPLLPHALRGFEGMATGALTASIVADGGGVPAGSQLASRLGLSKPVANDVRDLMKKLATGNAKLVVGEPETVEEAPVMPMLTRAL
ncbi:hypothetical protein [Amycolatopsis sp. lyj-23]|uniref:hypothetical protein n=1 Tax=Amycolatopsis sp. lyj-23 TaxID=2789283 RepID=UPI00397DEE09